LPLTAGLHRWRELLARIRLSSALLGLAVVLVFLVASLTAGLLWHLRSLALDEAVREARNLNLLIAEQTARSVQHVDFILRTTIERLPADDSGTGRDRASEEMARLIADTPQLRTMVVADADGVVSDRAPSDGLPFSIGDRSHFIALRDNSTIGMFISEPFLARLDGKESIAISRRINRADGSFGGIVAAGLDPTYFTDTYRALDMRGANNVALLRADGVCLARVPATDRAGTPCSGEPTIAARLAARPSGVYRATDSTDGVDWIVSYRHVNGLPLVNLVLMKTDIALEPWRRQARLLAVGAAGVGGTVCALIFLLAKQVRRREALAGVLHASEQRFRRFAEASSDWFWEQDENLRFTYLSPAVFERSGVPVDELLGKTRREMVTRGVSAEQWRQHHADLDARQPFRDFRFQRIMRDGTLRHISINGKPVFDDSGRFRGYAGNARDITPDIMVERRLLEAKAEAEAASRTKSDFLAVISHELRTPLNAIIGFSDVINREVLGPIGNIKYREYAGDILSAGRHLLGLINNILDMSKIEAQKMELFEETVDIATLAAGCLKIVERQAADAQIALAIDVPAGLPGIRGDEMRLKQILFNLLANAVKFTAAGGHVTLSAGLLAAGGIEIAVSDTGIGMSGEEIAIALQPFRQVESALARKHEGTGLGLPLVKAFVEMHGGALVLQSEPGKGTTARVVLPASRVVAQAEAAASPRQAAS